MRNGSSILAHDFKDSRGNDVGFDAAGDIILQRGSDTVNFYDNANALARIDGVIDGGDDRSTADGFIDTFRLVSYIDSRL